MTTTTVTATIWQQISTGVKMAVGARDAVADEANRRLMFRIGSGRSVRNCTVTLTMWDTYDVEVGHLNRKTFAWVVDDTRTDVYAETLSATVRLMCDREF